VRVRGAILPPCMEIPLKLLYNFKLTTGSNAITFRLNPNNALQPVVTISSAVYTGFAQYARMYTFYRVMSYEFRITFINRETNSLLAWVINDNNDPGTSSSYTIAANRLCKYRQLAPTGASNAEVTFTSRFHSKRLRKRPILTISEVLGSLAPQQESDFRALVTGAPADPVWIGLGIQTTTGAAPVTGCDILVDLVANTQFYSSATQ
jgi:hypothetical protein